MALFGNGTKNNKKQPSKHENAIPIARRPQGSAETLVNVFHDA